MKNYFNLSFKIERISFQKECLKWIPFDGFPEKNFRKATDQNLYESQLLFKIQNYKMINIKTNSRNGNDYDKHDIITKL